MNSRQVFGSLVFGVIVAPLLLVPGALGATSTGLAAGTATVALAVSTLLLWKERALRVCVAGLSLAALVGWSRAGGQVSSLNHYCGLALGVVAMAVVGRWCRTRERLLLATCVMLLAGAVALGLGLRSVGQIHRGKAFSANPLSVQRQPIPLPLSKLLANQTVNPNALGATAMLILPVAVAVGVARARWFRVASTLRFSGWLTAALAVTIVILTQSRGVWLSAGCVLVLLTRRWMPRRAWWLMISVLIASASAIGWLLQADGSSGAGVMATLQARSAVWRAGLGAWTSAPWFGIGFDFFRHSSFALALTAPYDPGPPSHAHNMFLQVALDVGLIGLCSYLAIVGYVLRRAVLVAGHGDIDAWTKAVTTGAALSLVSVHVYGLLDAVQLGAKVGLFQWLSCGLILAAWQVRVSHEAPSGTLT